MPRKTTTTKKKKSTVNKAGNYTKPTMRKRLFEKIKAGTKGGKAGQWSARKAQLLAKEYKAKGGGYNVNGFKEKSKKSYESGLNKNGVLKVERNHQKQGKGMLPEKAIKALSASEYARTTRKKREDTKKGKQHSKQPKKVARKTRAYRKVK